MKKGIFTFLFCCILFTAHYAIAAYPVQHAATAGIGSADKIALTTTVQKQQAKELKADKSAYYQKSFYGGKSKLAAALFALFLGALGVHSFYMGQTRKGFIQLGLYVVGFLLELAGAVSSSGTGTISALSIVGLLMVFGVGIWAFVDFIRILIGSLAPEEGFE